MNYLGHYQMKIEYLRGLGDIRFLASSTRIISNNLMRDDRLDVRFNPASFTQDVQTVKYIIDHMKSIEIPSLIKAATELWFIPARLIMTTAKFIDNIIDTIQHDIVLYSAHVGVYDYIPIKRLLERGFKVVMGGPTTIYVDREVIRLRLNGLGCTWKMLDNLIIVSGYVDLSTDLYSIIKEWKDTTIESNDFSTIWDCVDDPFEKFFDITKRMTKDYKGSNFISDSILNVVVFRNFCSWGKCTFCHYPFITKNNYIKNTPPEKVAENILKTCSLYKTKNVFLSDGCFIFNKQVERVLQILKDNNIYTSILIRIPYLKNKKIIDKINKYINMVDVGIESFNDFTLDYIQKGYRQADIFEAFDNIKKYMNNDIRLNPYLIIDLPYQSREALIENYTSAMDLQDQMRCLGFEFKYTPNWLEITPDTQHDLIDNKFIKRNAEGKPQGRHQAFEFMEKIGLIKPEEYQYLAIPFQRYDAMGNVLESDIYQIPESYTDSFCSKYGVN